jgi:hypothetical protein
MATPRTRLGQLLVDARMITQEALDEVLSVQRTDGRRLGVLLVERGQINEIQLIQILSHQLAVPWVSLMHIEFSRQLLDLVPREVAERYCLVPIYVRHVRRQGDTLYVAMDDPTNEEGLRACTEYSGLPVRAMIAPPSDIRNAIRVYYRASLRPPSTITEPPETLPDGRASSPARGLADAPADAPDIAVAEAVVDDLFEEEVEPRPTRVGEFEDVESRPTLESVPSDELLAASAGGPVPFEALPVADGALPAAHPAGGANGGKGRANDLPAPMAALLGAVLGGGRAEPPAAGAPAPPPEAPAPRSPVPEPISAPGEETPSPRIPRPPGRGRPMISLTLLDGTTITLPARARRARAGVEEVAEAAPESEDAGLTARDLVAALRAVSHGADASQILGANVRWEAMFAALLSLLLQKHLIADWEFVDELKKF